MGITARDASGRRSGVAGEVVCDVSVAVADPRRYALAVFGLVRQSFPDEFGEAG